MFENTFIINLGEIMKKIGIIAEYNPLHSGHIYHFNKIKEENPNSLVILVLSGYFTNRGDLSLFNKFEKTNQALLMGVDIVLELPIIYTLERADLFAYYTTTFLNYLGVDEIVIGSEENNIELYNNALNKFYINYDKSKSLKQNTLDCIPFKPNDLLGFFYYKSIKENNYNIILKTIKRNSSNFNDVTPSNDTFASAKAIRCNLDLLDTYTPKYVSDYKNNILDEYKIFNYLKYRILSSSKDELKNIFFVDEGIEAKLKDIYKFSDYNSFINYLSNKKYSISRIKRMLVYILLNVSKMDADNCLTQEINYARILGFNDFGKSYIKTIKKNKNLYTNIKDDISKVFDIELKTAKVLDTIFNTNFVLEEQKGPKIKEA